MMQHSTLHALSLAGLLGLAALAGCGDGPPTIPDPGNNNTPLTGTFTGTLAGGAEATYTFKAAQSGVMNVGVCGPAATNFDITVGGNVGATVSNCERVVFTAVAGRDYQVVVRAVAGAGAYNGCYATGSAECTVTVPGSGGGGPADIPDTSVYAAARGKSGLELLQALGAIIKSGHQFQDYTTARDELYADVDDPDNNDIIQDVYVGRSATVNSRATAATANYNAEHVWPQSCGANTATRAGTDLHILMSADATANGQRSNWPFGVVTGGVTWTSPEVTGQTERSRLGVDAQGRTVFEPRNSRKGDVARAIFYFMTRYYADRGELDNGTLDFHNFNVEEPTLLQWSQQDPPDAYEKARNDAVFRAQGNRNPYVDYPGLVQSVGDFPNETATGTRCPTS